MSKIFTPKKAQSSFELLLLIGLVVALTLTITYYSVRPRGDIVQSKADESVSIFADSANRVSEFDVGSRQRIKLEIPPDVVEISYANGQIVMILSDGSTQVSRLVRGNLVGFTFYNDTLGQVQPGIYDLILENFGTGVCVYPPGQREVYCYCFGAEIQEPVITSFGPAYNDSTILCDVDGIENQTCTNSTISYGSNITGLRTQCLDNATSEIKNHFVEYTITNWQNQTVFSGLVFTPDGSGYYNLTDMSYQVDNSDVIDINARCYSECFEVRQDLVTGAEALAQGVQSLSVTAEVLSESSNQSFFIPYGDIVPYLIDANGDRIYEEDCVRSPERCAQYNLLHPLGIEDSDLDQGRTEAEQVYVIRTGYECDGGECIKVNSSLWHSESN